MPTALGLHAPRLADVRALLEAEGRRERRRYTIEGPTLLGEALAAGVAVEEVYAVGDALARPEVAAAERAGVPVFSIPERALARLSDVTTPAGIVAVVPLPELPLDALLARSGPVLLLAGIADPGNAGTLLRTAEAFGIAGAIAGRGGADPFAPKVVRAAMGATLRLPIALASAQEVLAAAAAAGRPVVAADLDGDDVRSAVLDPRTLLAIGNERRGVRDWLPRWDAAVRIPQPGTAESLNAAVAGAILLYELAVRR